MKCAAPLIISFFLHHQDSFAPFAFIMHQYLKLGKKAQRKVRESCVCACDLVLWVCVCERGRERERERKREGIEDSVIANPFAKELMCFHAFKNLLLFIWKC